jgi:phosphatidylethanolamine N-methyltransferase
MRKLYGDSLRKDAGFTKVVKTVASRNARLLESSAGRHAPELKRVVREVRGTFEKVYEDTAEVVEEFLAKCMPTLPPRSLTNIDENGFVHSETEVKVV